MHSPPAIAAAIQIAALLGLAGCGYSFGVPKAPGGVRRLGVAPITEPGIDLDAAAVVSVAVRRSVARGPSVALASTAKAEAILRVVLLGATSSLEPFSSRSVRATQYRALIRIRATLEKPDGVVLWRSPVLEGRAPYLSVADAAETLDGAQRRAMAHAAADAADKLMTAMLYGG